MFCKVIHLFASPNRVSIRSFLPLIWLYLLSWGTEGFAKTINQDIKSSQIKSMKFWVADHNISPIWCGNFTDVHLMKLWSLCEYWNKSLYERSSVYTSLLASCLFWKLISCFWSVLFCSAIRNVKVEYLKARMYKDKKCWRALNQKDLENSLREMIF